MNHFQKKKLAKLKTAQADAEIDLAQANGLLNDAKSDDDRAAAQKLVDEAAAKLEDAKQAVADYEAGLKPPKGKAEKEAKPEANAEARQRASQARAKRGNAVREKIVTVTATQDRRRAGLSFSKNQPVEIPVDELTAKQMKALEDDSVLAVSS